MPIVKKIMETIIYLRECACNCAHFSPPIQNPKVINRNLNSFSFNCVLLEPEDLIPYRICLAASGGDHRLLVTWDFYSRVGSFYGQLSFTLVWKTHQVRLCSTLESLSSGLPSVVAIVRKENLGKTCSKP